MAAYLSSLNPACRHMTSTVSRHVSKSPSGKRANTSRHTILTAGIATPRKGMWDFMYACMPGARAGSAAPASPSRSSPMRARSAAGGVETSVGVDDLAGHERGLVAQQVETGVGDVLGLTQAANRDPAHQVV